MYVKNRIHGAGEGDGGKMYAENRIHSLFVKVICSVAIEKMLCGRLHYANGLYIKAASLSFTIRCIEFNGIFIRI